MTVSLSSCNPFVRAAEFQPSVLEGESFRRAYDHRLFIVLHGTGFLRTPQGDVPLSKGSLICIPPTEGYCFQGKLHIGVINYDPTRCCEHRPLAICPPPMEEYDPALSFDPASPEGFDKTLVLQGGSLFLSEITEMVTVFHRRDEFSDPLCSAKMKSLLAAIARQLRQNGSPETLNADEIDGAIRQYASQLRSNADLARLLGYHPVYLASVYKKQRGKTLHQAITWERLRLACLWLNQTQASPEVIAHQLGFSSRSHFCTVFKKEMGLSPIAWRKARQKEKTREFSH